MTDDENILILVNELSGITKSMLELSSYVSKLSDITVDINKLLKAYSSDISKLSNTINNISDRLIELK